MSSPTEKLATVELFGAKGKIVVNASDAAAWRAKGYCATEAEFKAARAKAETDAKAAAKKAEDDAKAAAGGAK